MMMIFLSLHYLIISASLQMVASAVITIDKQVCRPVDKRACSKPKRPAISRALVLASNTGNSCPRIIQPAALSGSSSRSPVPKCASFSREINYELYENDSISIDQDLSQFEKIPGIRTQQKMLSNLPKAVHAASRLFQDTHQSEPDGFQAQDILLSPDLNHGMRARMTWTMAPDNSFAVVLIGPSGTKKRFQDGIFSHPSTSTTSPENASGKTTTQKGKVHVDATKIEFSDMKYALEENMYISVNALAVPSPIMLQEHRNAKDYRAIAGFVDNMFQSKAFQRHATNGSPQIPIFVVSLSEKLISPAIKAHLAVTRYLKNNRTKSSNVRTGRHVSNKVEDSGPLPVVTALIHNVTRTNDDYNVGALLYMQPLRPQDDALDAQWKQIAGAVMSVLQQARSTRSNIWMAYQGTSIGLFALEPILKTFSDLQPALEASHSMCHLLKFLYLISIFQATVSIATAGLKSSPPFSFTDEKKDAYEEAKQAAISESSPAKTKDPKELLLCKDETKRQEQKVTSRVNLMLNLFDNFFPAIDTIENHAFHEIIKVFQQLFP